MAVFAEFGIASVGEVMDRDPFLAFDDAVRAHEPGEVLLSALPDTRYGLTRKDLVEWARKRCEPEIAFTHIPVRVADDSVSWEKSHTLVVASQTVAAPDLIGRLKERNARLDGKMPIERYKDEDPFGNHPLFKTEEQARIEETMDGEESIPAEQLASLAPEPEQPVEDDTLWGRSRDFDWGD